MMRSVELFFALLRNELSGEALSEDAKSSVTEEMLKVLLKCARAHDVAQIISSALINNDLLGEGELAEKFKSEQLLSVFRYHGMKRALDELSKTLGEAGIPFVPLKGSAIRSYYPEPWMRTSCDIDVLIHDGDVEKAASLLTEKLGYETDGVRNYHDLSLHTPSDINIELHFSLFERHENIDRLLGRAWEFASPVNDGGTEYAFTNEFFLFHIISHMSYHFIYGGCGVRPFIDLWLLEKKMEYDKAKLNEMLKETSLEKFYETVSKLCRVWFEGEEQDDITRETERFILLGGAFGAKSKGIAAKQKRDGGKLSYFLGRIFQPYSVIKEKYPVLKKHPILTPAYEVKRWFDLLRRGKLERLQTELNASKNVSGEEANEMNLLLGKLGL